MTSTQLQSPTVHNLPNGLTIVAEQMPVEAVNLNVWLHVGSAWEADEINGMAHFLEHMVFKGTNSLQSGDFERKIEERGAVTNAATSQEYTHYYITTAPQDFATLAPLQLDVVCNPSIPEDAFERERFVVLEEIRRSEDKCTYSGQKITQTQSLSPEPPFSNIVRREYTDPHLQQARLVMVWRVPGITQLSQTYALDVVAAILGQGRTSRLFRSLREDRSLVSQIVASNMTHGFQGAFYITAKLPAENVEEVERAIADHLRRLQTEPITPEELERIRTKVANHFIFSNERPSDRANLYGYYYSQLGDLEPALNYPAAIQAVQRGDVQAAVGRYLSPEAYGIVVMKPDPSVTSHQ